MRVTPEEALGWAKSILMKHSLSEEYATITADHLVDAELRGYSLAGLSRLPRLVEYLEETPKSPIVMETETPVSAGLDGGGQLGHVVGLKMTEIAIRKARERGMALIGARNCVYTGRNGFYVEQIARQGLVGLMMGNFSPLVAPWGSNEALLGTNPFSVGMPTDERPFVLDIGTASLMDGELRRRTIEHEPIPAGIGFDAEGSPTTDPEEALQGAVTAFGEHRGSGLALAIQAFGILAGSPPIPRTPHDSAACVIALSPGLLTRPEEFRSRVGSLLAAVRGARPIRPDKPVRVPGDRAHDTVQGNVVRGLELSENLVAALREL